MKKIWRVTLTASPDNKMGVFGEIFVPTKADAMFLAEAFTNDTFMHRADSASVRCLTPRSKSSSKPESWIGKMVKHVI